MPKTLFKVLTIYSWGWDLQLPGGWWLTYSGVGGRRHLYYSPDATSSHPRARDLWNRRKRHAPS